MNAPAPAPRRFTLRRAALIALLLFFAAALAVWLSGRAAAPPPDPLVITVEGFTIGNDKAPQAWIVISNRASRHHHVFLNGTDVAYRLWPTNLTPPEAAALGGPQIPTAPIRSITIPPHAAVTNFITLPTDGTVARIAIHSLARPNPFRKLYLASKLMTGRGLSDPLKTCVSVSTDIIQCPRARPDGTILPAGWVTPTNAPH